MQLTALREFECFLGCPTYLGCCWATSTGPVLVRCWQHRASTGPVLAHNGMFMGIIQYSGINGHNSVALGQLMKKILLTIFYFEWLEYNVNMIRADALTANADRASAGIKILKPDF